MGENPDLGHFTARKVLMDPMGLSLPGGDTRSEMSVVSRKWRLLRTTRALGVPGAAQVSTFMFCLESAGVTQVLVLTMAVSSHFSRGWYLKPTSD